MEAVVTIGVSGSGKSTLAKTYVERGYVQIERDMIRREIFEFGQWKDYKFTRAREEKVSEAFDEMLLDCSKSGKDVIISDTNLNHNHRNALLDKLERFGYQTTVVLCGVGVDYETIVERDASREYSVGQKVIGSQWVKWIEVLRMNGEIYQYEPDESLPKCVVFDIDGTLAKMGNRGPFDWKSVGKDSPRDFMVNLAKSFYNTGVNIVFLSGRDSVCRSETILWLTDNGLYGRLYMREEGSIEKDWKVKQKLFIDNIANKFNVLAVFDDRPQVVNMWNDIGIPNVIAVADQRVKF